MHGTVPAFLGIIPADDAMHMWTHGRKLMDAAVIILVDRGRGLGGGVQNPSSARGEVFDVGDVALEKPLVLGVDLQVVLEHLGDAGDRGHPFRVVEFAPWVVEVLDFVRDQSSGNDAVREAVAGVAGDDVYITIAGVLADERHVIDGLEDLARPLIVDRSRLGESRSDPILQLFESPFFAFLADFVVAAPNHEVIILLVAVGKPDVFVRIGLIVKQTILDTAFRNPDRDAICPIIAQLGHHGQFLQRDTGRFHGVLTGDGIPIIGGDVHFLGQHTLFLDRRHSGPGVAAEVGLFGEPFQHADQVLGRVEGRLPVENEGIALIDLAGPAFHRITIMVGHIQTEFAGLFPFFFEPLHFFVVPLVPFGILRDVDAR